MVIAALQCPHCSTPLTATDVLEACSVSVGESGLVRLQCPHCGAAAAARLADGRLELGAHPPAGNGAFLPTAALAEPELYVRRDASWVDCWFRKVYRRFPVGA
jgi:predicted RNA-binding Zn-ribbon protein involved in translation (DUF1610 family)